METKFKQKEIPEEYLKFGVYFKSDNDISTEYLVELCEGRFEGNAIVKIYSITDIPFNNFDIEGLINGSIVGIYEQDCDWLCEVDLCGKYFFPKFKNDMQLYYDDEKYYGGKTKTNSITSLMECINYAIEYGLNKSGIKPY
jgi:hypothetical protein